MRQLYPALLLATSASMAMAGTGAAELTLDRAAVRELIVVALPDTLAIEVPVAGRVSLVFQAPSAVAFVAGGVEAAIPVTLPDLDWSEIVDVRYVPEVEPIRGIVRLVPVSAVPRSVGPGWLDLAGWLDPIALPRRFDWQLELEGGAKTNVAAFVQSVKVEDDRVRIELGLSLGAGSPSANRQP